MVTLVSAGEQEACAPNITESERNLFVLTISDFEGNRYAKWEHAAESRLHFKSQHRNMFKLPTKWLLYFAVTARNKKSLFPMTAVILKKQ